jgi:hypothetical protein
MTLFFRGEEEPKGDLQHSNTSFHINPHHFIMGGRLIGLLQSGVDLAMEASSSRRDFPHRNPRNSSFEPIPISRKDNDESGHYNHQQTLSDQRNPIQSEEERFCSSYNNEFSQTQYPGIQTNLELDIGNNIHLSSTSTPSRGLLNPVVIPQRRPGNRSRGWELAYAPALLDCGISQPVFLDFLDAFNNASKGSPYLDAINVAAMGAGFAPGITPMVISMAVPIGVRMAKDAQTKSQSNAYLAKANTELFAPHGLLAMVMTWNPVNQQQADTLDTTNGLQQELPPSSPLVFMDGTGDMDRERSKHRQIAHFLADYGDRRARAQYSQENRSAASLLGPAPIFGNRFADPTNASNGRGRLEGLMTGKVEDKDVSSCDDRKKRGWPRTQDRRNRNGSGLIGGVRGMVAESMGSRVSSIVDKRKPTSNGCTTSIALGSGKQSQGIIKSIRSIGVETV